MPQIRVHEELRWEWYAKAMGVDGFMRMRKGPTRKAALRRMRRTLRAIERRENSRQVVDA